MIDTLLAPFQFSFMVNALLISVLIAIPTALLSCFLVLKGWALMGDAMSHAVFPGVVIAYIVGAPLAICAFSAGLVCALYNGFLKNKSRINQYTVMGIVFSGMFGFGLLLYVKIDADVHLDHILFGDMLGIGLGDIMETGIIAAFTALILGVKWRDLLLHAFDPAHAQAIGLRVNVLHYSLLCLIALTIVAALKSVGLILAIALLIAPGAVAFLLTNKFSTMLILSMVIALVGAFLGVYISFFIDSAPAPTIVLVLTVFFIMAFIRASLKQSAAMTVH